MSQDAAGAGRGSAREADLAVGRGSYGHPERWSRVLPKAAATLVASFIGFVSVPNELLAYLPLHGVAPRLRDTIVAIWVAVWFVSMCVLFVRLQGRRAQR